MSSALTVILWALAVLIVCFTIFGIIIMVYHLKTEVFEDWWEKENETD